MDTEILEILEDEDKLREYIDRELKLRHEEKLQEFLDEEFRILLEGDGRTSNMKGILNDND